MIDNTPNHITEALAKNLAEDIDDLILEKLMEEEIMIATLEFELPEDNDQLKLALRGLDYFAALLDIRNEIRNHYKYGRPVKEILDRIEELLYDVPLDDIS